MDAGRAAADAVAAARSGAGRRRRHRRRRRRPRAGHAAGRLPQRAVPDAARAAQHRLVLARPPRRSSRSTGCACQPLAAPQPSPLRGPPRHPLRRGDGALRRSAPARRLDHADVRARPTTACTDSAGPTRSSATTTTASSSAASTACASAGFFAGESMFHTATDASKVALVALVDWLRETGADAARRAVDDAAPALARRRRDAPRASTSSCSTIGGRELGAAAVRRAHCTS